MEFTQEQQEHINQLLQQEKQKFEQEVLKPVQEELAKYKPKEPTEAEKEVERLKAELLQQKVISAFRQAGAEEFVELISVSDEKELEGKVNKLQEVLKKKTIDSSYKPDNHKHQSVFDVAKSKGDTQTMIKALFGLK